MLFELLAKNTENSTEVTTSDFLIGYKNSCFINSVTHFLINGFAQQSKSLG